MGHSLFMFEVMFSLKTVNSLILNSERNFFVCVQVQ